MANSIQAAAMARDHAYYCKLSMANALQQRITPDGIDWHAAARNPMAPDLHHSDWPWA
jgi:hypothetical protein